MLSSTVGVSLACQFRPRSLIDMLRGVGRFVASRSIIACMSLCLIFQAVVWVTPSRRPNSMREMPPLL